MGVGGSRLKESDLPEGSEHYFGLENVSNICYSNSVLQCLYYCEPFREEVLKYYEEHENDREDSLALSLAELFH